MSAPDGPGAPVPYHRLPHLRPAWSTWWRPLLTVFIALAAFTVLASLLLVATVLALSLRGGEDAELGLRLGDPTSPLDVFMVLALGAITIPAALLGVRIGGWRPMGTLASVTGTLRRPLLLGALPAVLPFLAAAGIVAIIAPAPRADVSGGRILATVLIVVLLAPLHAAGQELAFRGIGQQAIGTWLRHPAWAILLPVPFSLLGRTLPDAGAVLTAVLAGAACGFLAWKSGGLELPIVLHLGVTASAMLLGPVGGPAVPGAGPSASAVLTIAALLLVTAGLTVWISRREGVALLAPVRRPTDLPAPGPVRF